MKRTLLTLLALASVAFAQTKSVSPTGGGLNETDNPFFRSALGGTTVGQNLFTLPNPGAITFPRINADSTVSTLSSSLYRTALGSTTVGDSFFTLANPSAITFPRINANNTVTSLNATDFRNAIGAGTTTITDSASLAATLSNETGTGLAVFGTSPTLTTPIINVSSDATGDVYYRSAGGLFTRLPIGTNGQLLAVSGGGLPSWSTVSIPSVEVTLAGVETLTNKTLSTGTIFSSPPTMTIGSDATGDIYYRSAGGLLTRLGVGADGQVLTLASGLPSWTAAGGGLTNWTDGINSATPNTIIPVASFTATNAADNVDAVIKPKGAGALLVSIPDNTATGGNKRGAGSVDLQLTRSQSQMVASGAWSVLVGGTNNTVSAQQAVLVGGAGNTASGSTSFIGGGANNFTTQSSAAVVGGQNNDATATHAFVGGGINNDVAGQYSVAVGGANNATGGSYSIIGGGAGNNTNGSFTYQTVAGGQSNAVTNTHAAIVGGQSNAASSSHAFVGGGLFNTASSVRSAVLGGERNTASGQYSTATGFYADTRGITAAHAISGGRLIASGDTQSGMYLFRKETVNATPVALTTDTAAAGTINQVILPNNSTYRFRGMVTARKSDGTSYTNEFKGAIKRGANAAATELIGSVTYDVIEDAGAAAWDITATADTTNGGLTLTITGEGATVRWSGQVETVEMVY